MERENKRNYDKNVSNSSNQKSSDYAKKTDSEPNIPLNNISNYSDDQKQKGDQNNSLVKKEKPSDFNHEMPLSGNNVNAQNDGVHYNNQEDENDYDDDEIDEIDENDEDEEEEIDEVDNELAVKERERYADKERNNSFSASSRLIDLGY
ncbi:MAG: hypothetical protein H7221_02945 [Flavobacterium sp.]|nr:hypothetical protein [Flavobacterium sp.]